MLQLGLDGFARQATTLFTSSLRTVCQVQLLVDRAAHPTPSTSTRWTGSDVPDDVLRRADARAKASSRSRCPRPCPSSTTCSAAPARPSSPTARSPRSRAASSGGLVERLLERDALRLADIVEIEPDRRPGIEYSPQFAQVAGAADVMVVATFDLRINERSYRMTICLPFSGLLPHLLRPPHPPRSRTASAPSARTRPQLVQASFEQVPVDVAVRFRPTNLDPDDLGASPPATCCAWRTPPSAPLDVTVDDIDVRPRHRRCQGPRLAALIVGTPKENR